MQWMILGGGGVFGLHLAREILGVDPPHDTVVSVGRNPPADVPYLLGSDEWSATRYRYEQVHVAHEPERLHRLIWEGRPDVVVNFAAQGYTVSWTDSWRYYDVNATAVARLCEFLTSIPRYRPTYIHVGTSELYGSVRKPADESAPLRPTTPYAVSKMAGELHVQAMARSRRLDAVVVRPSNAYGPGQRPYRLLPRAALAVHGAPRMTLEGGGLAIKSYMHAGDLARAIMLLAEGGIPDGLPYNVGPLQPTRILDLVEAMAALSNCPLDKICEVGKAREGEDACYWLDSSRIRRLGWAPEVALDRGLTEMLDWAEEWVEAIPEGDCRHVMRG